jgi:hypothetical protein
MRNKMKIYYVEGWTGAYDDYVTWIVKAYVSKAKANKHCRKLNDLLLQNGLHGTLSDCKVSATSRGFSTVLDPKMQIDYTGTEYVVCELELEE